MGGHVKEEEEEEEEKEIKEIKTKMFIKT